MKIAIVGSRDLAVKNLARYLPHFYLITKNTADGRR